HLPNFYLQARILGSELDAQREIQELPLEEEAELLESSDGSKDPRWCRVDVIDPNALPRNEKLAVSIETDREIYRPGQQLQVKLHAAHPNGQPAEAELSLAAVDDAVFSFAEGQEGLLADQFSRGRPPRRYMDKAWRHSSGQLWRDRLNRPQVAEAMARAIEQLAQMKESMQMAQQIDNAVANLSSSRPPTLRRAETPVASFPLGNLVRRDFRETAAWIPQIQTGPDGLAEVELNLPDSLTRFRLTSVGLTKSTAIGTARKTVEVTLPVSVQLFLPRFAIEGDSLEAVAVIHNNTDALESIEVRWTVDSNVTTELIEVPARSQTRVTRTLTFAESGEVEVAVFAGDADAVERTLTVHPWGRERTVRFRGKLEGAAAEETLPPGFVPQRVRVSMTREEPIEVSEALEGLRYLLGYPHGCVEQTMSRFLPAVMTQKAVRTTNFVLPEDIEQQLPEFIERGLTRLYGFQRPDGGWGWWKNDQSDPRMTAYVLYGLARCQAAGVNVDDDVMNAAIERT
ncbi:MAG: alpha-2-macroglobulin family protein, partial [Verrucomicrobiota bacterium]